MQNTLKQLFEQLSQVNHIYLNEVITSRHDYHGFTDSDVSTTSKGNCIMMREDNGCKINLKNLDDLAITQRFVYIWTFDEDYVRLERSHRQKIEHLLDIYELDTQLVNLLVQKSIVENINAEILINDGSVEIMINKGCGESRKQICLDFSRDRLLNRLRPLPTTQLRKRVDDHQIVERT